MQLDEEGHERKSKLCRGYVVRNPFNEGVEKAKGKTAGMCRS